MEQLPPSIDATVEHVRRALGARPKLGRMFARCFPNTLATTTEVLEDGSTYVFTGDIPAMWLRDSSAQVRPYLRLVAEDEEVAQLVAGLVRRQLFYIGIDPYANAFNRTANGRCYAPDETETSPWVWERKYEIDSLCYPLQLSYQYWRATGRTDVFEAPYAETVRRILALWRTEQRHQEESPYRFQRRDCPPGDTLSHEGYGAPVGYSGMTWSGFRPSDDACRYGYLVPSNAFAVVVLGYVAEVARAVLGDEGLAVETTALRDEIESGIQRYGICEHAEYGKVFAYETDALGNHHLMDDANVPSLLSLPYLGYVGADDEIYRNTRRLLLSSHNPYYNAGKYARGIGSPHTPAGYIWPIALCMQGLTSGSVGEMEEILDMLEATDAGTELMHEGFDPDDPTRFTREWFAWANSLFSEFVLHYLDVR
jgi:uncharacterized protein